MANFLYEACLHWGRQPQDDAMQQLLQCWLNRVQKFTVSVIKKGFDEYLESEAYFPVPGTVFPYIKYAGADRSKPRVGVYEASA